MVRLIAQHTLAYAREVSSSLETSASRQLQSTVQRLESCELFLVKLVLDKKDELMIIFTG